MAAARAHTPEQVAEVCGVDRAAFDTFADWYGGAKTVGVSVGNGIERGRSGGSGRGRQAMSACMRSTASSVAQTAFAIIRKLMRAAR